MNYQRIYDSIIDRAKSENRVKGGEVYYEAHHIVPVCMGGTGRCKDWSIHPNIVLLTGREHFLCHWLLHLIYPNSYNLSMAFVMMCNVKDKNQQRYTPSSRIIEYSKYVNYIAQKGRNWTVEEKNKITGWKHTEEAKKKMSDCNKGKKFSDEHKRKIGLAHKGKIVSEETRKKLKDREFSAETRENMSNAKLGKKLPDEHKKNIRLSRIGIKQSIETVQKRAMTRKSRVYEKSTCPHCNKIGGKANMVRYHFNNCKMIGFIENINSTHSNLDQLQND